MVVRDTELVRRSKSLSASSKSELARGWERTREEEEESEEMWDRVP